MNNLFSLPPKLYEQCISLPKEKLLIVTRTHPATLILPFVGIGILGVISGITSITLMNYFTLPIIFHMISIFGILFFVTLLVGCSFVEWYFHLYVITTRKIVEMRYRLLFSHLINDVLLDQVRCTEIDIVKDGFFHELFNMGSISITFDRPTHQEAFILNDIPHPEKVGMYLSDTLDSFKYDITSTVWYKTNSPERPFRFTEEIMPKNPEHLVFS